MFPDSSSTGCLQGGNSSHHLLLHAWLLFISLLAALNRNAYEQVRFWEQMWNEWTFAHVYSIRSNSCIGDSDAGSHEFLPLKNLTYSTRTNRHKENFISENFTTGVLLWEKSPSFSILIQSRVVCLVKCRSPGRLGLWSSGAAGWKGTQVCLCLKSSASINQT